MSMCLVDRQKEKMMDARELLQNLAKSCGFDKGAVWMYDNALMFIKGPDPLSHRDAVEWMYVYVRIKQKPKLEHDVDADTIVRAKSWEDLAARVYCALSEDSLYVHRSKIDKNSAGVAEFMINCVLNGYV